MERIVVTDAGLEASEILIGTELHQGPSLLPENEGRARVAILVQPSVSELAEAWATWAVEDGAEPAVRVTPDRDDVKSLAYLDDTARWLNGLGLTRHDTIVGVGGGALTDFAGFAAATYLRGVEIVLAPTTLLGAVDAAIGGKTAVNVQGKNLVGAFRHPRRVSVDISVLERLPEHLRREGSAEAVKAGFIADPELIDLYERDGLAADLAEVVPRAIAVKAQVVSADFTEEGQRAVLNYGHTIGHAIEVAASMTHGDAIAVGMRAAANASEQLVGFRHGDRQASVLAGLGLPAAAPGVSTAEAERLIGLDKKRDRGGLNMVLLRDFGDPIVQSVDRATVRAALETVGAT